MPGPLKARARSSWSSYAIAIGVAIVVGAIGLLVANRVFRGGSVDGYFAGAYEVSNAHL